MIHIPCQSERLRGISNRSGALAFDWTDVLRVISCRPIRKVSR